MFAVGLGAAAFSPSFPHHFEGFGRSEAPTHDSFSLDDIVSAVSEVCCFDANSLHDSDAEDGSYYEPPLPPLFESMPLPVPAELESSAAPRSPSGEISWSELNRLLQMEVEPSAPVLSAAPIFSGGAVDVQALPFSKEGTGDSNRARDAAERVLRDALGSVAMKALKQRHTKRGKPPIKHLSYGLVRHYAIENGVRLPSTDDLRAVGWDWQRVPEDRWRVPVACERYEKDLCEARTCTGACETCARFLHGALGLPPSSRKRPRPSASLAADPAPFDGCAAVGRAAKAARPAHAQSAVLPQVA